MNYALCLNFENNKFKAFINYVIVETYMKYYDMLLVCRQRLICLYFTIIAFDILFFVTKMPNILRVHCTGGSTLPL